MDYFTLGGTPCTSLNFIMTKSDHLKGFKRDIELHEVPGRSGDLLTDNKRKKNKEINIEGFIDCEDLGEVDAVVNAFEKFLEGERVEYRSLLFSNDRFNRYRAICLEYDVDEEIEGLLQIKIKFSAKEDK